MNLKELLKKSTPLPWRLGKPFNGFVWGPDPHRGEISGANWPVLEIMGVRNAVLRDEDKANAALVIHAVTMLPKVVKALKDAASALQFCAEEFERRCLGEEAQPAFKALEAADAILAEANNPKVNQ